ncbi:MAG: hypothetical protein V7641_4291 [Blastocatellia bacterium]
MDKMTENPRRVDEQALTRHSADAGLLRGKLRDLVDAPIDTHLERIELFMDRAIRIPGTNLRFGLDPIIGFFFPVVGDWVGTFVSAYIVLASIRHGLPKRTITRMVFNVAVDFLVGSIPLVGDAVDFAWKSNSKNLRLLNKYAKGKGGSVWSDWVWVFALFGLLLLFGVGLLGLAIYAIKQTGFKFFS